MKKSLFFAHLALIIAGILFGANYWVAKGLMPEFLSPEPIIVFRSIGAALLFALMLPFIKWKKIDRKDWWIIVACALSGVTINQYLFFVGLNLSSPIEASVLHTISPIVVLLLANFGLKEKIGHIKGIGIFFGFLGALIVTLSGKEIGFNSLHFTGNVLIILNISAYSIYLVMAKPLMQKYSPVQLSAIIFLLGSLFFLPFGISSVIQLNYTAFPPYIWYSLLYVVVATTFLTYLLTIYALKPLQAGTVGFYIYLQPLISGAIGIISGRELLSRGKILGALFIFMGVFIINYQAMRRLTKK